MDPHCGTTINDLPVETLDWHIFSYFNLHYLMGNMVPVCKKWKHICESSIRPKQLTLIRDRDILDATKIIKKYQPTTIQINCEYLRRYPVYKLSIYSLIQLVRASERCHTLVLPYKSIQRPLPAKESQKLKQITTLCLTDEDARSLEYFPNVENLHFVNYISKANVAFLPKSVKYIAVHQHRGGRFLGSINQFLLGQIEVKPYVMESKTYMEYYMEAQRTKLATLLHARRYEEARKLLHDGATTLQREIELRANKERCGDYLFGCGPIENYQHFQSVFNGEQVFDSPIARDLYEQLSTCGIDVPIDIQLNLLLRYGTVNECISLATRHVSIPSNTYYLYIRILLRDDVGIQIRSDKNLLKTVKDRLTTMKEFLYMCQTTVLDQLQDFIDWHGITPFYDDKIPRDSYVHFITLAINNGAIDSFRTYEFVSSLARYMDKFNSGPILDLLDEIVPFIFDVILNLQSPLLWYDVVTKEVYESVLMESIYDPNRYALTFFKHFPDHIESFTKKFQIDWDYVINTQGSPFVPALEIETNNLVPLFMTLLKLGVDPKKVPRKSPSILSLIVINERNLRFSAKIYLIDALLAFDVDINELSFNYNDGSKHSALTLAIVTTQPANLIEFMRLRGALTDEEILDLQRN